MESAVWTKKTGQEKERECEDQGEYEKEMELEDVAIVAPPITTDQKSRSLATRRTHIRDNIGYEAHRHKIPRHPIKSCEPTARLIGVLLLFPFLWLKRFASPLYMV